MVKNNMEAKIDEGPHDGEPKWLKEGIETVENEDSFADKKGDEPIK